MNLLHVTPYYAPAWAFGGVVQAVTGLAETQAASGHTVIVLTTDALDRSECIPIREEVRNGVRVVRSRNWSHRARADLNLSTPTRFGHAAHRLLHEGRVELIHFHELRTLENLLVASHARRLGIPMVVSPHGTLPYTSGRGSAKRLWDALFGRRLAQAITHVIALTETEASDARALWAGLGSRLLDEQLTIVPNGVRLAQSGAASDRSAFRQRWSLGEGNVILFLGRLAERKGLRLLISAFADLVDLDPDARLVIAGPDWGILPALKAQLRDRRLEHKVTFTGSLTQEAKQGALRAADVFVLPATGEGFSIAALEAMACGLPVVLGKGCNFPAVASQGAGFIVPPGIEPLAGALKALSADRDLRSRMGMRGRELVASGYSWPQVASQVERIYDVVTNRSGPSANV